MGNMTNGKGKVRRECQVLKTTNKLTIQGGIYFRGSTCGRKFDSRLEGRRGWFTIFHVEATKKVTSILRLGKNKYDEMVSYFLGIDIGVRMASRKTSVKEKAIHFGIPSSRSLHKAI